MRALIFDIRRFSTHDGCGLRSCIFFKGCPMQCAWCQNPEGICDSARPVHFEKRCMGCGACVRACTCGGMRLESGKLYLNAEAGEDWARVMDACPTGALRMDARSYEIEELVDEAEKDRVFFRRGGGVTLTGGEPLMQGAAAAALVRALHVRGIHAAIETSLCAPMNVAREVLSLTDEIFADLKLLDDEAHRRATGASNAQILENLSWLLRSELADRVTVRTPLIPGWTASNENIAGIARFISGLYPQVRYELLNYNPLAQAKYRLAGRAYCFTQAENPRPYAREALLAFGEIAKGAGVRNLILDI